MKNHQENGDSDEDSIDPEQLKAMVKTLNKEIENLSKEIKDGPENDV